MRGIVVIRNIALVLTLAFAWSAKDVLLASDPGDCPTYEHAHAYSWLLNAIVEDLQDTWFAADNTGPHHGLTTEQACREQSDRDATLTLDNACHKAVSDGYWDNSSSGQVGAYVYWEYTWYDSSNIGHYNNFTWGGGGTDCKTILCANEGGSYCS
jgi:hypothetical protein